MSEPKKLSFIPHVITADALGREPDYIRKEIANLESDYLGIVGLTPEQLFYLTPQCLQDANAKANQPGNPERDAQRSREATISEIGTKFRLFVNMAQSAVKQKQAGTPSDEVAFIPLCLDGRFDCL